MGFIKGQTGNPDGRPKGSPNKVTADLRELLKKFIEDNFEQFTCDFKALDTEMRVSIFAKLLMHIVPKAENDKNDELVGGYVVHVVDANDTPIADIKSEDMN
jgi:hypothetical protein